MTPAPQIRPITDLTLGTYLRKQGHKILKIDRDGHRSIFLFAETPALEKDVLAFYNGEARVEPLSFTELLRSLKAAAMSRERAGGDGR